MSKYYPYVKCKANSGETENNNKYYTKNCSELLNVYCVHRLHKLGVAKSSSLYKLEKKGKALDQVGRPVPNASSESQPLLREVTYDND
jgi:hypothetical protein